MSFNKKERDEFLFWQIMNTNKNIHQVASDAGVKEYTAVDIFFEQAKKRKMAEEEILEFMYYSKKFTVFFNVAKDLLLGKRKQDIKKNRGVLGYHLVVSENLLNCESLIEEVEIFLQKWLEISEANVKNTPKNRSYINGGVMKIA